MPIWRSGPYAKTPIAAAGALLSGSVVATIGHAAGTLWNMGRQHPLGPPVVVASSLPAALLMPAVAHPDFQRPPRTSWALA